MLTDPDTLATDTTPAEAGPLPSVFLKAGQDRRISAGHPWAYSNEVSIDRAAGIEAGSLVTLRRVDGKPLGVGFFNPHTLIAVRLLSREAHAHIDKAFLANRLQRALALRERFYTEPYYRLAHAEADGLPGLIVDRFGSVLVVQTNAAGMERLQPLLLDAIDSLLAPTAIVLRGDSPARALEGLPAETTVARGNLSDAVEVIEDGLVYYADVCAGQKTGWYFDQRPNRAFVAPLAQGERMLDVFCHTGGFAIRAAAAGAREAIGVDSSESALTLARRAATAAGLDRRCSFAREDAFAALTRFAADGARFRLVVADPPPFARSRKDVPSALKGYRKLARLAAAVVEPGGFLFIASCSHAVEASAFAREVALGIGRTGRTGRLIRESGAGPDHPQHLHLPESAYLKTLLLQVD